LEAHLNSSDKKSKTVEVYCSHP